MNDTEYKHKMENMRWANWKHNESGNYAEIDRWLTQSNSTFEWAVVPSEHPQSPP
jgi:DNA modification methylase